MPAGKLPIFLLNEHRLGVVMVICMLAMGPTPPAEAQALKTPKPIVIRTGTLSVDFVDSAADSGAKGAIVAKTSALTVDFADTANDSGARGAIVAKTSALTVDFADTVNDSGAKGAIAAKTSELLVTFPP
jgi:hypothetical protein